MTAKEREMSLRKCFRETMAERRQCEKGGTEWQWRTRAARKYVWMLRGIPPMEWGQ